MTTNAGARRSKLNLTEPGIGSSSSVGDASMSEASIDSFGRFVREYKGGWITGQPHFWLAE